jgi:hypothetical protein
VLSLCDKIYFCGKLLKLAPINYIIILVRETQKKELLLYYFHKNFYLCHTTNNNLSKNMNVIRLLSLLAFLTFVPQLAAFAQCDAEVHTAKSVKELEQGFIFMKSYRIDGKEGQRKQVEYTCVLNKDTSYMLRVVSKDGKTNGIIATLYDAQRVEVATNHLNNKMFEGWTYKSGATGVYFLIFTFKDSQTYCGGASMGFKK